METPDIYLLLASMQDDRSIINMLSVDKKFNNPKFFHQVFSQRYPYLMKYKKEDQDWKQFYLEMVMYINMIKEEFNYDIIEMQKFKIFSSDNPKEIYYEASQFLNYSEIPIKERIAAAENDTTGKILDISDIASDGRNIRFVHAPSTSSKKKPIQGLKIYSDKLKSVITLAKLIGDYSIINRWTGL